jgi:hypothetical protein
MIGRRAAAVGSRSARRTEWFGAATAAPPAPGLARTEPALDI